MPSDMTRRTAISSLWTLVALNIAFADILALYTPGVLPDLMRGVAEGVMLSETLMLVAAVFIQIPVAMIVATQLMPVRALRLVTSTAIVVTALFIVGGGSPKPHYVFFAGCEILALLGIALLVWRTKAPGRGSAEDW